MLGLDVADRVDLLASLVDEQPLDHKIERLLHAIRPDNRPLPEAEITRLHGFFQVFRANTHMPYLPDGPIQADITVFKATDFQPRVLDTASFLPHLDDPAMRAKVASLQRTWSQFNAHIATTRAQPHLGWERYTTGVVTTYDASGDHMNMVQAPHAQALARAMRACLTRHSA